MCYSRLPERNIDLEFMKEHHLLSEEFIRYVFLVKMIKLT